MGLFQTHTVDLRKLNSLTKYPSIPTYHAIGDKGCLTETVAVSFTPDDGSAIVTEKVDGANARLVFTPDGRYLIGSREEWLHASGDLVYNPTQGVVDAVKSTAERLLPVLAGRDRLCVLYVETYGSHAIGGGWKSYSKSGEACLRLFDVAEFGNWEALLGWDLREFSRWREDGGQPFYSHDEAVRLAGCCDVPLVPRLVDVGAPPISVDETYQWLGETLPQTLCGESGWAGRPEGVVVRTPDRKKIAKLRFEDYERTLRRRVGRA